MRSPPSPVGRSHLAKGSTWIAGSLDDRAALEDGGGADAVIHVAGVVNAPDAAGFEAANVLGTGAVLAAARKPGSPGSSMSARSPRASRSCRTMAREGAVRSARRRLPPFSAIVRPPAIYGPGDREARVVQDGGRGFVLLPPAGRLSLLHAADLARLLLALPTRRAERHDRA